MIPSPRGILICLVASTTILIYHHTGSSRPCAGGGSEKNFIDNLARDGTIKHTDGFKLLYAHKKSPTMCMTHTAEVF